MKYEWIALKARKMNGQGPRKPKARKITGYEKKPSSPSPYKNLRLEQEDGDSL